MTEAAPLRRQRGLLLRATLDHEQERSIRYALRQPVTGNPNAHALKWLWSAYLDLEEKHLDALSRQRKAISALKDESA